MSTEEKLAAWADGLELRAKFLSEADEDDWREEAGASVSVMNGAAAELRRLSAEVQELQEALKAHLREHWLAAIVCDHEAKTDTAICSCSRWRDQPHPSVGAAANAWIEHVFATLPSAAINGGETGPAAEGRQA